MRRRAQVLQVEVPFEVHKVVHHWLSAFPCVLVSLFDVESVNLEVKGDMMALVHGVEPHRGIHEVGAAIAGNVFDSDRSVGGDTP